MKDIPRGFAITSHFSNECAAANLSTNELFNRYMDRGWSLGKMVEAGLLLPPAPAETPASSIQVGGNHYKQFPIQPAAFSERNKLTFLEASVVKRVCRHSRGGKGLQDIDKAIHELQLIKEYQYGDATPGVSDTHAASAEVSAGPAARKIPLCTDCGLPLAIGDHRHQGKL